MAMHFLDKFSLMVIKITSKFELRRMCGALGATAVMRLGPCTPEEMGECSLYVQYSIVLCSSYVLHHCATYIRIWTADDSISSSTFLFFFFSFYNISYFSYRIEVREVGGRKVIVFSQQQDEDTTVATIIIRASTEHVLNDVEVRTPTPRICRVLVVCVNCMSPHSLKLSVRMILFVTPPLPLTELRSLLTLPPSPLSLSLPPSPLPLSRELLMTVWTPYVCYVQTSASYPVLALLSLSCARGV